MVPNRIDIGFTKPRDALVLIEKRSEARLRSVLIAILLGNNLREFLVIKHRHFGLTSPAPEHLHDLIF
jgi:hypothetical protein